MLNKFKICYIIDSLDIGGKEIQLLYLIKGLINKLKLEPKKIMIISLKKKALMDQAFRELGIKFQYAIRNFRNDFFLVFKMNRLLKKFNPDIIHTFSVMASFYTVLLRIFRKFVFFDGTIRSAPPKSSISFKHRILNAINFIFADIIITNSKASLNSFKVPVKKFVIIHNGFDMSRLEKLEKIEMVKRKFKITTRKVVGMVANFTYNKDYKTFISAAKILLKKRNRNDITFLAIGNGIHLKKFKKFANDNRIKFPGVLRNIESIINIFDVGVLSTYTEGISNAIMEYMALEKPVVATDCLGTRELIIKGKTGFLIRQKSPKEMAEKIEYLLNNEETASKMGQAGRKRIVTDFSIEKMINSYFKLYSNLFKNHRKYKKV